MAPSPPSLAAAFLRELAGGPFVEPAGWALLHFVWQGFVVAALLALALALAPFRRASAAAAAAAAAAARYVACCAALALMAAAPVVTFAVMASSGRGRAVAEAGSGAYALTSAAAPVPQTVGAAGNAFPIPAPPRGAAGAVGGGRLGFGPSTLHPVLPWAVVVWAAGVFCFAAWHVGGWVMVRRLVRRDARPLGPPWPGRFAALARRMGVRRPVRLLESARAGVPLVAGWLRPVVLVPASALTGLAPHELEAILAHELAHVRRHDYLVNLVQVAVETLLFYHPAVWWVSAQIRHEREDCCDDLAAAACGDRQRYARALARLEELRSPAPVGAAALTATGGNLLRRVRRLLNVPDAPHRRRAAALAPAGMSLLLLLTVLGLVAAGQASASRPSARPSSPSGSPPPAAHESDRPAAVDPIAPDSDDESLADWEIEYRIDQIAGEYPDDLAKVLDGQYETVRQIEGLYREADRALKMARTLKDQGHN